MAAVKKILVVDDEEKIVEVLKAYLINAGYLVYEAFNGHDALEIFERVSPSLVLLDLMMPSMSGIDVCKVIRKKSRIPVIMLTAKIEEEDMLAGLAIGADDYIKKPFSPKEVLARISTVLRRCEEDELTTEPVSFDNDYLIIDFKNLTVKKEGIAVDLTPTEFKIFTTLAKSPAKVFTRDQLISFALNDDFEGFDRTIDTYIKKIRQKIEKDTKSPKYIITVHGTGYRFGGV